MTCIQVCAVLFFMGLPPGQQGKCDGYPSPPTAPPDAPEKPTPPLPGSPLYG